MSSVNTLEDLSMAFDLTIAAGEKAWGDHISAQTHQGIILTDLCD
jgi:hypothetical protein